MLYPPAQHVNLYPYGDLDALHPNGLISYKDAPVREDGLPVRVAAKARVRAIERELARLELGKKKGKGGGKERKRWMEMHDEALDELAKVMVDEGEDGEGEDDFDMLMAGLEGEGDEGEAGPSGNGGDEESEDDEEEEEEEEDGPTLGNSDDEIEDPVNSAPPPSSSEPSSFSRIPTHTLHIHLNLPTTSLPSLPSSSSPSSSSSTAFPKLANTPQPYILTLSAGEMLYLPASWWHEVTSSSPSSANGENEVHMAFNYWFYPPTSAAFGAPYKDELVWGYLRDCEGLGLGPVEESGNGKKRKVGGEEEEKGKKKAKR